MYVRGLNLLHDDKNEDKENDVPARNNAPVFTLECNRRWKENSMKASGQTHGDVSPSVCARKMALLRLRLTRSSFLFAHFSTFPLRFSVTKGSKREFAFRRVRLEGSGAAYIQVAERTLMIAGKTEEDLIPLNLRVYGIHTFTTYLNIRTIVALVRAEESSVDTANLIFLIMGDPCNNEALGQSP